MNLFNLKISSPEGDLFCGDIVKLSVRGTEGELAVMAGHVPFITSIVPCDCRIELEDGSEKTGRLQSGILTVMKDKVVLLSGSLELKNQ